jgi:hypothetical protein
MESGPDENFGALRRRLGIMHSMQATIKMKAKTNFYR